MDVGVDEGGREEQAAALDDPVPVRVEALAEAGDQASVDADVHDPVDPASGIQDARAPHDEVRSRTRLAPQHHATSMADSTGTGTGPCVSRS